MSDNTNTSNATGGVLNASNVQAEVKKTLDWFKGGYIPKSGGVINGTLLPSNEVVARHETNDKSTVICGGSDHLRGSYIHLSGNEETTHNGNFYLCSSNGEKVTSILKGTKEGDLTWNGQNIVRTINHYGADKDGNIDAYEAGCVMRTGSVMKCPAAILNNNEGGIWFNDKNEANEVFLRGGSTNEKGAWMALRDESRSGGSFELRANYLGRTVGIYGHCADNAHHIQFINNLNRNAFVATDELPEGWSRVLTSGNRMINYAGGMGLPSGDTTLAIGGFVTFYVYSGSWGGGSMYINGTCAGTHYGKETGGSVYAIAHRGDVLKVQLDGSVSNWWCAIYPFY